MSPEDVTLLRSILAPIVAHRIVNGLSRREVAHRMGVSRRDVCRIETCRADLHMSTLRRYCLAVGVVTEWRIVPIQRGKHRAEAVR